MQTIASARPSWATAIRTRIDDQVWVELDSGSIVPIDASGEVQDLLEAGVSVLVDLDSRGEAVPWSTVVAAHSEALTCSGIDLRRPRARQPAAVRHRPRR
jgi:hypothetical protein